MGKSTLKLQFSIAMLNCQRVSIVNSNLLKKTLSPYYKTSPPIITGILGALDYLYYQNPAHKIFHFTIDVDMQHTHPHAFFPKGQVQVFPRKWIPVLSPQGQTAESDAWWSLKWSLNHLIHHCSLKTPASHPMVYLAKQRNCCGYRGTLLPWGP